MTHPCERSPRFYDARWAFDRLQKSGFFKTDRDTMDICKAIHEHNPFLTVEAIRTEMFRRIYIGELGRITIPRGAGRVPVCFATKRSV